MSRNRPSPRPLVHKPTSVADAALPGARAHHVTEAPAGRDSLLRKIVDAKGFSWFAEDGEIRIQFHNPDDAQFVWQRLEDLKHGR